MNQSVRQAANFFNGLLGRRGAIAITLIVDTARHGSLRFYQAVLLIMSMRRFLLILVLMGFSTTTRAEMTTYVISAVLRNQTAETTIRLVQGVRAAESEQVARQNFVFDAQNQFRGYTMIDVLVSPLHVLQGGPSNPAPTLRSGGTFLEI